jgi:hypothetical protein
MRATNSVTLHLRQYDYCKRLSIPSEPAIPNCLYGLDAGRRKKGTTLLRTGGWGKGNSLPLTWKFLGLSGAWTWPTLARRYLVTWFDRR